MVRRSRGLASLMMGRITSQGIQLSSLIQSYLLFRRLTRAHQMVGNLITRSTDDLAACEGSRSTISIGLTLSATTHQRLSLSASRKWCKKSHARCPHTDDGTSAETARLPRTPETTAPPLHDAIVFSVIQVIQNDHAVASRKIPLSKRRIACSIYPYTGHLA